jgi:hypothetical protein
MEEINNLQKEINVLKNMINYKKTRSNVNIISKKDLQDIVKETLIILNGKSNITEISKYIWKKYNYKLLISGDIFYTWQYDIRWVGTELRKLGIMKNNCKRGVWELSESFIQSNKV